MHQAGLWEVRMRGAGLTMGGWPALRLAVNSTPGRGRLCTQRSGLVGARGLAQAGRRSLWWRGGDPGGKGAQCARVDHPGPPDSCKGKPHPLNLLTRSTLAPSAALWTCRPVCLETRGPPGQDSQSQSPLRTSQRKAALPPTAWRGTLPLGASLSRPPGPALAPSQDTALPGLKSQSTVPAWGQGEGLGLSGALHVC